MPAVVIEIADAVVEALNDATLSQPFTAERAYVPVYDLQEFSERTVTLTVVPTTLTAGARDLAPRANLEWVVGVWVQRKAEASPAAFDPLMNLAEEIVLLFNGHDWRTRPAHRVIGVEARPPFDPEIQYTAGLFTAVVLLTFRSSR